MTGAEPRGSRVRDVLLVDPSLFTAPYDAALAQGLSDVGIRPHWAVRELRPGEDETPVATLSSGMFYRLSDGRNYRAAARRQLLKGIEHLAGLWKLVRLARRTRVDLVHFQWVVLPLLDDRAIGQLQRRCPVVVTVHDSTPFNGKQVSRWQRQGLDAVLRRADRIIIHTPQGRAALVDQGIDPERIAVVPHGVLPGRQVQRLATVGRWRVVLFGKLQAYKGVDVLIEAIGMLDIADRELLSITIAGEPMIDMDGLVASARAAGLGPELLDFRLFRHSDAEMAALLGEADAFVFPYRAIDASGVLFAVAPLGRWLIASELGAFTELIGHDESVGSLVAAGDAKALAAALTASIGRKPSRNLSDAIPSWTEIGAQTSAVYEAAWSSWHADRTASQPLQ